MLHKYTSKEDSKLKAVRGVKIPFQGKHLQPCQGLSYFLRWGVYYFDIRDLGYKGGPLTFHLSAEFVRKVVGDIDFMKFTPTTAENYKGDGFIDFLKSL